MSSEDSESGGRRMEDSDASAAAEATLGLSPQLFVAGVHDHVNDIAFDAFEFCLQEAAAPGVLGAAKASQKAAELERGLNVIRSVVSDLLDKRMTYWEKYCHESCFTVPKGFTVPEDVNSCAKEPHKDGTSFSDLDAELDSLRRKIEIANNESENLRKELFSLERQTTYKRKIDSSISEIHNLFEDESVQKKFEDLAKAIPILQQKMIAMKRKRTEVSKMNGLRDNNGLQLDEGINARTEDIQEIVNIVQN